VTLGEEIAIGASNLQFEAIAKTTVERAKQFLIDTIGVCLAGLNAEGVSGALEMIREYSGAPQAKIFGVDLKAPAPQAAFLNSLTVHSRDFDDLYEAGGAHVNVTVIPAALAAAQKSGGVSGRQLLTAIIAGVDLPCRLCISVPLYRG